MTALQVEIQLKEKHMSLLTVSAPKYTPPPDELDEYATDAPHVHLVAVVMPGAQHFGGPVPASTHVVGDGLFGRLTLFLVN